MEKRIISRTEFPHPISLDMMGKKKDKYENISYQGVGVDISEGGLGLSTLRKFEKGKIIRLLIPALGGKTTIPVFSVIRWSEALGTRFRVGLQFLG